MSLELCILASGSSGNCAVLRTPAGILLIDAGIGPRTAARRLEGTGVKLADISGIVLTHLDRDHFSPNWLATIVRQDLRVFCHESRAGDALAMLAAEDVDLDGVLCPFGDGPFIPLPGVGVQPISLAHDRTGSHGFLIEAGDHRAGYATDLGRVPAGLFELFSDLDVLALESNYDPAMQRASGRPWFLQRRITGGAGHLSNEQAFAAVRQVFDLAQHGRGRLPSHVVLLHRSRQCNCPDLVRRLFARDPRIAARLTLAHQSERTEWLRPAASRASEGEQLTLAWG